jgi:hypothetical protein
MFVTVGQISVWQQSANTEEVLIGASNHDWCPQIRVHRARVGSALHQKRSHSTVSALCGYVKWSQLKLISELNVSSGL